MDKTHLVIAEEVGKFLLPLVVEHARTLVESEAAKLQSSVAALAQSLEKNLQAAASTEGHIETLRRSVAALRDQLDASAGDAVSPDALEALGTKLTSLVADEAAQRSRQIGIAVAEFGAAIRGDMDALAHVVSTHSDEQKSALDKTTARTFDLDRNASLLAGSVSRDIGALRTDVEQVRTSTVSALEKLHAEITAAISAHGDTVKEAVATHTARSDERSAAELEKAVSVLRTEINAVAESTASASSSGAFSMADTLRKEVRLEIDTVTAAVGASVTQAKAHAEDLAARLAKLVETAETKLAADVRAEVSDTSAALRAEIAAARCAASDAVTKTATDLALAVAAIPQQRAPEPVRDLELASKVESLQNQLDSVQSAVSKDVPEIVASVVDHALKGVVSQVQDVAARVDGMPNAERIAESMVGALDAYASDIRRDLTIEMSKQVVAEFERIPKPEPGKEGPPGTLDTAHVYEIGWVCTARTLVTHKGALWQATRETVDEPVSGSADWLLLTDGVTDIRVDVGADEKSITMAFVYASGKTESRTVKMPTMVYRYVYSPDTEYHKGDAVTYSGSVWVASADSKGVAPGKSDGVWRLAVKRGGDGKPGRNADPSEFNLGFVGTWVDSTIYQKDNIVDYAGSLWLAKRVTKATPPYLSREDTDDWLRLRG